MLVSGRGDGASVDDGKVGGRYIGEEGSEEVEESVVKGEGQEEEIDVAMVVSSLVGVAFVDFTGQ